jgi:hypothetical protein
LRSDRARFHTAVLKQLSKDTVKLDRIKTLRHYGMDEAEFLNTVDELIRRWYGPQKMVGGS